PGRPDDGGSGRRRRPPASRPPVSRGADSRGNACPHPSSPIDSAIHRTSGPATWEISPVAHRLLRPVDNLSPDCGELQPCNYYILWLTVAPHPLPGKSRRRNPRRVAPIYQTPAVRLEPVSSTPAPERTYDCPATNAS